MVQKYIKIFGFLVLAACQTTEFNFPKEPVISLNESPKQFQLNGKDSAVEISFHYTDGDGDIGLSSADTTAPFNYGSPYFYNLLVSVYRVDNGVAQKIAIPLSNDTVNFNDRIDNITPTGKNKAIFGDITLKIKALPYPGIQPDSMYYTLQIIDRQLHVSNLIQTPTLKFNF
jgi:hypothetical protein